MLQTLTRKVVVTGLVFMGLIGIMAAFAIGAILELQDATAYLTGDTFTRVQLLQRIRADLVRALGETEAFLHTRDASDLANTQAALTDADTNFIALQAMVGERDDEYDIQSEADLVRLRDQLRTLFDRTQQLVRRARAADTRTVPDMLAALEQLSDDVQGSDHAINPVIDRDVRAVTAAIGAQIEWGVGLVIGLVSLCLLLTVLAVWMLQWQIVHPVRALARATQTVAHGDLQQAIGITNKDEIGSLQQAFNAMVATIRQQIQGREEQVSVAEAARSDAEAARAQIAAQLATIEAQRAVIGELSVPILPLTATTLVMPLVGALDSTRIQMVLERLLQALEQSAARHIILDITGVPLVDSQVAQGLIRATQAARLLGVEVVLVGIRPEVAQTIVGLGIHLEKMITHSTLQDGIAYVLQKSLVPR